MRHVGVGRGCAHGGQVFLLSDEQLWLAVAQQVVEFAAAEAIVVGHEDEAGLLQGGEEDHVLQAGISDHADAVASLQAEVAGEVMGQAVAQAVEVAVGEATAAVVVFEGGLLGGVSSPAGDPVFHGSGGYEEERGGVN